MYLSVTSILIEHLKETYLISLTTSLFIYSTFLLFSKNKNTLSKMCSSSIMQFIILWKSVFAQLFLISESSKTTLKIIIEDVSMFYSNFATYYLRYKFFYSLPSLIIMALSPFVDVLKLCISFLLFVSFKPIQAYFISLLSNLNNLSGWH